MTTTNTQICVRIYGTFLYPLIDHSINFQCQVANFVSVKLVCFTTCFQALLQIAHHVELKKKKESEKWRRQIKLLTPEEVANLVRIRDA